MEPISTPSRAMTRVRSEEPYSTPVKSFEPRSRELTPTIYGGSLCTKADSSWLRSLEQQVLDRLRKDAYLLSTLKRSMHKDMEEQLQLARRELEVFFARELRALRDSTATTVEVQAIAAEMKTLHRSNGSENLAEAVAKLCGELDHITKEAVTQTSLQASMRSLRAEVEETLRKNQGLPEDRIRRDQQLADLQDIQDQVKELKSQQDRWEVSHRQREEDCAQNFGFLKEELEQHRQQMKNDKQIYRQDLKKGLSSINDKVEALRFDLDAANEKLSKSPGEDTKLPHAFRHELAVLSNDLAELKRQVKQQSLDLLKRRDDKDDLVEGALGLRLANIEEQVLTIKPQLTQISQLREHVVKLSNTWQLQGEASSIAQRVAQLEGSMLELQSSRRRTSPSPTRKEEPSESLWAKQMAALSVQQDQYCEQLAIVEDKVTNLWQLTPRICELEHQQKDFWRLQEQLKSLSLNIDRLNAAPMASAPSREHLLLQLSEQRQVTERRIEQLKGELLQYTTSVADVRDEMRRMIGQQGEHFLKLTGENYSGFLDRLAGLERQLHERAPESQKLKSLMEETTLNLERRLNSFERQLKEGQTRAMDTRFEHLDGIRRPLESRLSTLELQLREARETESPSPEPRLASMERKPREGQEEHARQLRGFEERCELLETAMSRVSGALPRLSSDIMRDWEALANERFAEAKVTQELQRVAQRMETLPESMERCEQELALYRTRLDSLPEVATAQQLQRLNEDLGALKTRLACLPDRGAERLCSLEEAMKSISWELKELATQFGNVAQMQSQMQNLDGQMEIVTGLIHRMDAMGRFLQHIQDGMRCET